MTDENIETARKVYLSFQGKKSQKLKIILLLSVRGHDISEMTGKWKYRITDEVTNQKTMCIKC